MRSGKNVWVKGENADMGQINAKNCNLTTCRYNENGKCTNEEKRKECVEVSEKVLCEDKMCEFCKKIATNDKQFFDNRKIGGDFIYHDENGYGILIDTGDSGCLGNLLNINFCPICGRKLNGE